MEESWPREPFAFARAGWRKSGLIRHQGVQEYKYKQDAVASLPKKEKSISPLKKNKNKKNRMKRKASMLPK